MRKPPSSQRTAPVGILALSPSHQLSAQTSRTSALPLSSLIAPVALCITKLLTYPHPWESLPSAADLNPFDNPKPRTESLTPFRLPKLKRERIVRKARKAHLLERAERIKNKAKQWKENQKKNKHETEIKDARQGATAEGLDVVAEITRCGIPPKRNSRHGKTPLNQLYPSVCAEAPKKPSGPPRPNHRNLPDTDHATTLAPDPGAPTTANPPSAPAQEVKSTNVEPASPTAVRTSPGGGHEIRLSAVEDSPYDTAQAEAPLQSGKHCA
ncbi:hypothetical protein MMC18_002819 [Xylographa bjoerkii]|nr:hypothetical protein [Xylographa bjoerkii]